MAKRSVIKYARPRSDREITERLSFKTLTHLGTLRAKVGRGEITAEQVPALLALGQNGGGPNRRDRRRQETVERRNDLLQQVSGQLGPHEGPSA